jgi:LmeA-like phospholipid-binding
MSPGSSLPPSGSGGSVDGDRSGGGPLLALLARALELWLRQQCQEIDSLEIQLKGSAARVLQGQLEGAQLRARRVVFQDLRFESVELWGEAIRLQVGSALRGQAGLLREPFRVRGQIYLSSEDLNRSLGSAQWRQLGDNLAEELLGVSPLVRVRILDRLLLLSAPSAGSDRPIEVAVTLAAADGTVVLQSQAEGPSYQVPMDPAIRIERAELEAGTLLLEGEALVRP